MSIQPDTESEALDQVRYERDRLQAVLDAIGTGLLIADENGVVRSVNPEAERLLGAAKTLVGKALPSLLVVGSTQQSASPLLDDDWLSTIAIQRRWQMENIRLW